MMDEGWLASMLLGLSIGAGTDWGTADGDIGTRSRGWSRFQLLLLVLVGDLGVGLSLLSCDLTSDGFLIIVNLAERRSR